MVEIQPDLVHAIDLQRILVRRSYELFQTLDHEGSAWLSALAGRSADKIARGEPLLHGEELTIPLEPLTAAALDFCRALEEAGAGQSATRTAAALHSSRLDAGSLFKGSIARADHAISAGAVRLSVAPDALWLIGELATAPFAYILQRSLTAALPSDVFAAWEHGYCPVCGSWPAYGERAEHLRCSFCAGSWPRSTAGCIYCGEAGDAFSIVAVDDARPGRMLETCTSCGGYLKTLTLEEPVEFPLVAVEDLATADLDAAAADRGFRRPELRHFEGS